MKKLFVYSVFGLLLTSCSAFQAKNETELTNKEKAVALIRSLQTRDQKPVGFINPNKYIQHNLMVGDGIEGFGRLLHSLPQGSIKANVIRAFSDGNYVFIHTDYEFMGPKAGFDIFRFEKGKIVEHWDNLAIKAKKTNPSGRTQFDGETKIKDISRTVANKKLVKEFVDTILIKGQYSKLSKFFNGDNYIQHNTNIGDGVSGLGKALELMAKRGIKMTFTKNHKILGEGNFVLAVSEGYFGGEHVSYYDLFRIENNKIAEHWDVIEKILPKNKRRNSNGKFGFK